MHRRRGLLRGGVLRRGRGRTRDARALASGRGERGRALHAAGRDGGGGHGVDRVAAQRVVHATADGARLAAHANQRVRHRDPAARGAGAHAAAHRVRGCAGASTALEARGRPSRAQPRARLHRPGAHRRWPSSADGTGAVARRAPAADADQQLFNRAAPGLAPSSGPSRPRSSRRQQEQRLVDDLRRHCRALHRQLNVLARGCAAHEHRARAGADEHQQRCDALAERTASLAEHCLELEKQNTRLKGRATLKAQAAEARARERSRAEPRGAESRSRRARAHGTRALRVARVTRSEQLRRRARRATATTRATTRTKTRATRAAQYPSARRRTH